MSLLAFPTSVVIDRAGDLYVADAGNNRIQEIAARSGLQWNQIMERNAIYTVAGSALGNSGISGDFRAASSSLLDDPTGLALDSAGDLYIADAFNNRIQEISASRHDQWGLAMRAGDIYTVAGSASGASGYSGDGEPARRALLASPVSVAADPSGNLYINDGSDHRVREVVARGESGLL